MKITLALVVACLPYLCYCRVSTGNDTSMDLYCNNCTQECEEEPPPYSECPSPDFCKKAEGNNLALAFGLTIGAGFATNIGAILSFLPCFKRNNVTLLAVGLALAAGFMVYIAFVDILGKAGEYFCCHSPEHASLASTGCFFLGIVITLVLQYFLDALQGLDLGCRPPWSKKKEIEGELEEQDKKKKYSGMMKSLKSKLTGKSADGDTETEKTIGVPNVVVESEKSGETKFDSTADSEIVVLTDENSDEVSVSDYNTIVWHVHVYFTLY
jgi:hypothetical protein